MVPVGFMLLSYELTKFTFHIALSYKMMPITPGLEMAAKTSSSHRQTGNVIDAVTVLLY